MTYRNMRTGELEQITLYDACLNKASEVTLMNTYRFDNGLNWKEIGRASCRERV